MIINMLKLDITDKLREFYAGICSFIYQIIAWVYELFINISRVEILTSEDIQPIYERVTLILSIIMVFYITFEFVKFVVQPDGVVDKEKGAPKTVFKMIVVVVLIAFVPTIFTLSYKVQNIVFDNQLFSKIILGKQDVNMETFGRDFSANVLSMFYYVDESIEWKNKNTGKKCGDLDCKQIVSLNNEYLRQNGKLPYLAMGLDEKADATEEKTGEKVEIYKINFDGIFAIGVGAFVAYMLILYCIDAGVRVAQMTFLQIIAPIPIIGYLSPKKDGIFQKWVKQCITTYLDLFLRVGIIYFVLLVCQILSQSFSDGTIMENATNATGTMKIFMFIALVMGLLLFAKKAPKMLQELFPSTGAASGNFGLKAGERVAPMAARAIGGTLGATRLVGGALKRGIKASARNVKNGQSVFTKRGREAISEQQDKKRTARNEYREARNAARAAQRKYNRTTSKTDTGQKEAYDKARQDLDAKRNAYADAKNKSYRSVVGNTLWGGVQGAYYGAKEGAKATKLEDVSKQVKSAYKKDNDQINSYEKYLDNGGAGGISGAIDRGITKVTSSVGAPTRADRIEQSIKQYDDQIKEQKQLSSVEGSIIKSADQATAANVKKIEDGQLKQNIASEEDVTKLQEAFKKKGVEAGEIKNGQSLADIYINIKARANAKRDYADQLSKNAASNPALKEEADKAQEEAVKAEQAVGKAAKVMGEYTNTQILLDPNRDTNGNYEKGAVIAINTAIQRLKDASAQPSTMEKLKEIWRSQGKDIKKLEEYMADPRTIKDFGTLDDLGKMLNNIAETRNSETQEIENSKNRLTSGAYASEVKSNVEYNNSSNNSNK